MLITLLLLLAIAAVYVGTIETAFSALMRLSLRFMAERGGRSDRLGFYLEDPIQLFLPARLLLGIIFSLSTMFIALLIVRRNPERVLEVLLPPFDVVARSLHPLTGPLVGLIAAEGRRERADTGAAGTASDADARAVAP